ncbi:MAG: acetoacetate decarboxylase family protein [Ilumatobacteraceae bacterium]
MGSASLPRLSGFAFPRTASGGSSILPPPPWHYSGDLLTVEYRTDPMRVAELLPVPLTVVPDDLDPGAVAIVFADWQSCGADFSELDDPVRAQYREAFVVVRCAYRGEVFSRCVYIWVDKDFAMVRGHFQGYPKKLGSIWMTRPVTIGKAGPRVAPGGRFAGTVAHADRRIVDAHVTLREPSDSNGFVNGHAMLHSRWMPAIEADGRDSLDELVTMRGVDVELGQAWRGDAELELSVSPVEELHRLHVDEIIGGYWRSVGTTFAGGVTISGAGGR